MNPNGTERGVFETDGNGRSSPAIGEDGTVYFGSYDNNLYAITGEHTLNIDEPTGEGSIEVDGQEITSWPYQGVYEHGTEVELEAIADTQWFFKEWTGDYTGEDNPTTVTMDDEKEITAVFDTDQITYELEINIEGKGTVEVDGTEFADGDTDTYLDGTDLTLEADPAEGWEFDEWQGTDETGESIIITMDEDKEITAIFQEDVVVETYELTLTIEGPGTVYYDLDPEAIDIYEDEVEDIWVLTLEEGTEVTLYIDEDDEENFENWDLPDTLTDELDEYDLEIVFEMDEDKEITANFEEVDVEGILDDLFERGMICIAIAIIIPIIIIIIIIVVIVKLLGGKDKDGEQPPQQQHRPPGQQPPSQQQAPPPEEEISIGEEPTSPEEEYSGEVPPPPPEG